MQFSENTNLNEIYGDLLEAVYERGYETHGHRVVEGIEKYEFVGILQEIALACWHGNGRTTTVKEIETHCDNSGLRQLLNRFQQLFKEDSRASITRLLTAFYFRESGDIRESEKTFEFTHKSFGEYLTAKRIVQEVQDIHEALEERKKNYRKGCDEREALIRWAIVCGLAAMDEYLFSFVVYEMRLQEKENVSKWQKMLCHLIEFMLVNGMPMEGLNPRPSFYEEMRQSRNAEEALLAVLNACARVTKEVSEIQWPSLETFGAWIAKLQGQRISRENVLALQCLSYLNLQGCILVSRDFLGADLKGANLGGVNLEQANLVGTNLVWANLVEANLVGANLGGASLVGANLRGADFERANLRKANLEGAGLEGTNLVGANLGGTDLVEANLRGANFYGANLQWANLERANFVGANLQWADLKGTILEGKDIASITVRTEED